MRKLKISGNRMLACLAAAAVAVPVTAAPVWGQAPNDDLAVLYQTDFATWDDETTPFATGPLAGQDGWIDPGARGQISQTGARVTAISDSAATQRVNWLTRPDTEASLSQWIAVDFAPGLGTGDALKNWNNIIGRVQPGSAASAFKVGFATDGGSYQGMGLEVQPVVNSGPAAAYQTKYLPIGQNAIPEHAYRMEVSFETPDDTTTTVIDAAIIDKTTGQTVLSGTFTFNTPALAQPGGAGFYVSTVNGSTLTGFEYRGTLADPPEPPDPDQLSSFDFRGKSRQDVLDAGWTVQNESPEKISFGPDGVTITAEAGHLSGTGGAMPRNILRHAAPGDWDARVHVSTSALDQDNEQVLIGAFGDADNYVKLARSSEGGQGVQLVIEDQALEQSVGHIKPVPQTDLWLRLVKQGEQFTGYYSVDGLEWILVGTGTKAIADADLVFIHFPDGDAGDSVATFSRLVLNTSAFAGWPEERQNVALKPGVVASASTYTYGYEPRFLPSLAIDGGFSVTGSRWAPCNIPDNSGTGPLPAGFEKTDCSTPWTDWWQVKLAEPTYVYSITAIWEGAGLSAPTEWKLQLSHDGITWVTVANPVNNPSVARESVEIADSSTAWQYIRVQGVSGHPTYGLSITEFEVYDAPQTPPGAGGRVLPVPVSQADVDAPPFTLTAESRIVVSEPGLVDSGEQLATYLRGATGYELPVATGSGEAGDIVLVLNGHDALLAGGGLAQAEGYVLEASANGLTVTAPARHGLFNAFQTIRQLLPQAVFSPTARFVPWEIAATEIVDYPRFGYRGLMVDPARNFLTVAEVKAMVDDIAAMKGNKLQWHLSDSQSWRLEIKGPPEDPDRYASLYKTAGCNGGGCLTGWYTQEEFQDVVAYAAERFVEIVPDIEGPAHASRAVSQVPNLSCGNGDWFCTDPAHPNNANAKAFMQEVYTQLAAISPSQYVHIGGDEADGMAQTQYTQWIQDMEALLSSVGKTPIGWTPTPSAYLDSESVHHYWRDQTSAADSIMSCSWYEKGFPVLLSPTSFAYLDFQGPRDPAGNYAWDPSAVYDDYRQVILQDAYCLDDADIIGIQGQMWGESLRGLSDNRYLILTSMAALIEKAWSPEAKTQGVGRFLDRLARQSARWAFEGVNYRPDGSVSWDTYGAGSKLSTGPDGAVVGQLAGLSSTGVGKAAYTAVIDWADGSGPEAAVIDGANAATNRGPTLFTVSGSHTYEPGSVYTGTVTFVEGANTYPLPFQVVVAADKAALVAAVNDAEQLDPSDYTPESWVGFEAALNAARGVLADAAATQGAVGGAVSALASATDDLVEVAASLDLSVSVVPRCMGGKAYLNTSVKNNGDPTADISTVTPYGSKASAGVTSGRAASGSFNSRLVSIPAGLVTVQAVSAQDDAEFLDTIAYAALDCG